MRYFLRYFLGDVNGNTFNDFLRELDDVLGYFRFSFLTFALSNRYTSLPFGYDKRDLHFGRFVFFVVLFYFQGTFHVDLPEPITPMVAGAFAYELSCVWAWCPGAGGA